MTQTGGYDTPQDLSGTANGFVISLPTLSGSGTGLGVSLDLGLSPSALAQQAYDYLNNSFSIDQGFVNQSISGTQGFLSNQISPILLSAANQIQQNAKYIPDLYSGLTKMGNSAIAAINQNTAAGIAAQNSEAQASIAASNSAASSGGGCFITSSVCESLGLPDDNVILKTLRGFRDSYMGGKPVLRAYYKIAPLVVCAIDARSDSQNCYRTLLRRYILPACRMIDAGFYDAAERFYTAGCKRALRMAEDSV